MGWAAAHGDLDIMGLSLFAIQFLWQMPHFFAIAWMFTEDYRRAGFKVHSSGVHTGRQINGQDRYGIGIIDTATKQLLPWRTQLWDDNLARVGGVTRIYGADVAPDDSYFVVTSGSGGDAPPTSHRRGTPTRTGGRAAAARPPPRRRSTAPASPPARGT